MRSPGWSVSGTWGGQARRVRTLEEGDEIRTRDRRPAAGAHKGLPQFFSGFRCAPPRSYVPSSFQDLNYHVVESILALNEAEQYESVFMNSSNQSVT
jgi:hypothetical protein